MDMGTCCAQKRTVNCQLYLDGCLIPKEKKRRDQDETSYCWPKLSLRQAEPRNASFFSISCSFCCGHFLTLWSLLTIWFFDFLFYMGVGKYRHRWVRIYMRVRARLCVHGWLYVYTQAGACVYVSRSLCVHGPVYVHAWAGLCVGVGLSVGGRLCVGKCTFARVGVHVCSQWASMIFYGNSSPDKASVKEWVLAIT